MEKSNSGELDLSTIRALIHTIKERRSAPDERSYTASLLSKGVEKCAEKVGEEAVETVIALVSNDKKQIVYESADLLYHLLVALEAADLSFEDVLNELKCREGVSGHTEKASRKKE